MTKSLTPDQLEEDARLYEHGDSLASLGRHFNIDAQTMNKILELAGVAIRPRRGWAGER